MVTEFKVVAVEGQQYRNCYKAVGCGYEIGSQFPHLMYSEEWDTFEEAVADLIKLNCEIRIIEYHYGN